MKTDMTPQELRELDAWIAEHVMGWTWWRFRMKKTETAVNAGKGYDRWQQLIPPNETWHLQPKYHAVRQPQGEGRHLENETDLSMFHPTTDPAAAMEVLAECGNKCSIVIVRHGGGFLVAEQRGDGWTNIQGEAPTLPEAIAKFAKQLFSSQKGKEA